MINSQGQSQKDKPSQTIPEGQTQGEHMNAQNTLRQFRLLIEQHRVNIERASKYRILAYQIDQAKIRDIWMSAEEETAATILADAFNRQADNLVTEGITIDRKLEQMIRQAE